MCIVKIVPTYHQTYYKNFKVYVALSYSRLNLKTRTNTLSVKQNPLHCPEGRLLKMRILVCFPLPTFLDLTSHSKMSGL